MDGAYIDRLFDDVTALYRLDQIQVTESSTDLGPLPAGSAALLTALCLCWLGIGGYLLLEYRKNRKNSQRSH